MQRRIADTLTDSLARPNPSAASEADRGRNWCYPGARWWKFDLHAHTPASSDYGKGAQQAALREISKKEWLLGFMRAGVDCVAVTDHNSGDWIDALKDALRELETEMHPDFRPLRLFPGVEITASTGTHVLGILDVDTTSADIASLLGGVGYRGQRGACDTVAEANARGVAEAIGKAGGIPILAHVDRPSGAWELPGNALTPLLDTPGLFAIEVVDPGSAKPDLYRQRKLAWAEVLGSDSHHPTGSDGACFPGSHYTWVKMAAPSLEGLRLALMDGGGFSVRRSDESQPFDPWVLPEHFVEAIEIEGARYMGRGSPATFAFNPWLNALVGGRGTGKSTVLHTLRLVAGREPELMNLDEASEPRRTFERFNHVPAHRMDKGGLEKETKIRWTVMRDGVRHRIQWSAGGRDVTVEEQQNDNWKPSSVQAVTLDRFPLRLFSQGQIAALSGENQQALMHLIDEAAGVDPHRKNLNAARDAFRALRARIRELEGKLSQRGNVNVRLQDVERKLKRFEEAGHSNVLTTYRLRRRQDAEVQRQIDEAAAIAERIEATAATLQPEDVPGDLLDTDVEEERHVVELLESLATAVRNTAGNLRESARELREFVSARRGDLNKSAWRAAAQEASDAYSDLVGALRSEGVSDPSEYGRLAQERQLLDTETMRLESIREELDQLEIRMDAQLTKVEAARRDVSRARDEFLERTLSQNNFVRIRSLMYGNDPRVIERSLREALDVRDDRFAGDILVMEDDRPTGGVVSDLLRELPAAPAQRAAEFERRIARLKDRLTRACGGAGDFGGHFNNHLARESERKPEVLDNLLTWFPEDGLSVEYSRAGDGQDFRPITQASAGQRSAAMLAFLLAHGAEPLVLDQPEDDLDNHLIYDLIVRQIRENKVRRQIIVVTHNPNIVVNGDAEMLHALDFVQGQCLVMEKGSLQDAAMRDEICRVMEGGREAFGRRYRRLGQEPVRV